MTDMKALSVQKKTVALIENGTWAVATARQMRDKLAQMKDMNILDAQITIKSAMRKEQEKELEMLADSLVKSL